MEYALCPANVLVSPPDSISVGRPANALIFSRVTDVFLERDRAKIVYSIVRFIVINVINNIRLSAVVEKPRNAMSKVMFLLIAKPVVPSVAFAPDCCASQRPAFINLPSQFAS
jgi:hypothetical protein